MDTRSLGRLSTQMLSSLSTARPVTPPIFHLFGSGFGQSGSNLKRGAVGVWAPPPECEFTHATPASRTTTTKTFGLPFIMCRRRQLVWELESSARRRGRSIVLGEQHPWRGGIKETRPVFREISERAWPFFT